jgi:carboxypeptidase PM20D1
MVKRVLWTLLLAVVVLAVVIAGNTWRRPSLQLQVPPAQPVVVDEKAAADRLAGAIPIRTVSGMDGLQSGGEEFKKLHAYLAQQFPKLHATLKKEVVGDHALLYTWTGSDSSARPIALMAHQDVVPIAPGTEKAWAADPFSGQIKDGFVWGRGTWDNKGNLIAQLEALERLLAAGVRPKRTVYFIYGHDEEVGGRDGAVRVGALLEQRGIKLEMVLDEGLVVTEGILPGIAAPAALVGVAEKGSVSLKLVAEAPPGHSSMPPGPGQSAIGRLAQALAKLDANPLPGGVVGAARSMFEALAPEMSGFQRVALSNLWLFGPVVEPMLAKGASTNALMRTTTAMTILSAGNKENVLPGRAEAVVNFRILPGDSAQSIAAFVRKTIDDEQVKVDPLGAPFEPSRVSSSSAAMYRHIEQTVREVYPGSVVAPGLMLAATDGRHFERVADNVYRFTPVRASPQDLQRFHGTDERLSVDNLAEMIRFYHRLLQLAAGA